MYAIGFLILVRQGGGLLWSTGLLPIEPYLRALGSALGSRANGFLELPSLFWLGASDTVLTAAAWIGLVLALVLLCGFANVPLLVSLWALYMSFVHVGQIFYGYGWEIMLLETGFLAVFLAPPLRVSPFPRASPTPSLVLVLLRWELFRLMLGAGLIKLRGDPCWRDLTCMVYHYETQPLPNPLSPYLYQLPLWFHKLEVLFNHLVELVAPWGLFAPAPIRHASGVLLVTFQVFLILSGNLSFLNWLTLSVCAACFDDSFLGRVLPKQWRERLAALGDPEPSRARAMTVYALVLVVAVLSLNPIANMLSPRQAMNTSHDPLDLVNSYGAFGSIGRERYEIVLEATLDADPTTAHWVEYEFNCKPGDVSRRPCVVSPYHFRIDWQMWFAAMGEPGDSPWLLRLVEKLLEADPHALSLLARAPFAGRRPTYLRAGYYRYQYAGPSDPPQAWWHRTRVAEYLPALSTASFRPR
jgi:hypothetical protein